ncbi:MAG TPA: hypothetical protein VL096_19620, partial [Pirellulaceae bacterium]|nr:hypothetical protein [Pirellulaceae bacterium]
MWCAAGKRVCLWTMLASIALWPRCAGAAPTQEVIMNEQVTTTYRPLQRHVVVPIREYRTRTWTHGWWNPFATPKVVNYHIPETRWEERMETS